MLSKKKLFHFQFYSIAFLGILNITSCGNPSQTRSGIDSATSAWHPSCKPYMTEALQRFAPSSREVEGMKWNTEPVSWRACVEGYQKTTKKTWHPSCKPYMTEALQRFAPNSREVEGMRWNREPVSWRACVEDYQKRDKEHSISPKRELYLKVGTYNLEGWRQHNPYEQAAVIKNNGLNIICIQEGSDFNAAGKLAKALGSGWQRYGNYYIQKSKFTFEKVSQKPISHGRYIDNAIIRSTQTGQRFSVLNTHWDHRRGAENNQNLEETREFLRQYTSANQLPAIIMGDFNRVPYGNMFAGFQQAIKGKVYGSVDSIYVKEMSIIEGKILSAPSDHDLVVSTVRF